MEEVAVARQFRDSDGNKPRQQIGISTTTTMASPARAPSPVPPTNISSATQFSAAFPAPPPPSFSASPLANSPQFNSLVFLCLAGGIAGRIKWKSSPAAGGANTGIGIGTD